MFLFGPLCPLKICYAANKVSTLMMPACCIKMQRIANGATQRMKNIQGRHIQ